MLSKVSEIIGKPGFRQSDTSWLIILPCLPLCQMT
jgi:hypothetical protein